MLNDRDLHEQTDLLCHSPEGTCLELRPGAWLVRGRTRSYGVNEHQQTCGCPHFQHRLKPGEKCRHLELLEEFLNRGEKTCPLCRGEGCHSCDEKGRTSIELHDVLLEIKQAERAARDAALREMFK